MTAAVHDLEGEVLFSKGRPMNTDRTEMPYPSQINPASLNPDINQVRHRQMYALEAVRQAVSAMACQNFSDPVEREKYTLILAKSFLAFIMGE